MKYKSSGKGPYEDLSLWDLESADNSAYDYQHAKYIKTVMEDSMPMTIKKSEKKELDLEAKIRDFTIDNAYQRLKHRLISYNTFLANKGKALADYTKAIEKLKKNHIY